MQDLLGVDPRAVIDQITVLRIGHSANIELFQYEAPDQRRTHPRNSDWSGHHVAFYVTDIDAAVAYMDGEGRREVPRAVPAHRRPRRRPVDQLLQDAVRDVHRADQLSATGWRTRVPSVKPLWSPKRNGLDSEVTTVPGLLGIDHVGITVPERRCGGRLVRGRARRHQPADVRPVQRPDRRLHAPARRRRPARGRRADQDGARRKRPRRRALPVHGARPGPRVPQELRLGRPPHRVLRPPHRQGGRVPAEQGRAEAARAVPGHRRAPPPARRSTTSRRRSAPTSS